MFEVCMYVKSYRFFYTFLFKNSGQNNSFNCSETRYLLYGKISLIPMF